MEFKKCMVKSNVNIFTLNGYDFTFRTTCEINNLWGFGKQIGLSFGMNPLLWLWLSWCGCSKYRRWKTLLYKLFHSVIDQNISHLITAHYTSPCYFPSCTLQFCNIHSRFSRSFTARGYLLGNPPGYKANKL